MVFTSGSFKSFFFNNFFPADEPVVAIFSKNGEVGKTHPGEIAHYKAILKSTALWYDGSFKDAIKKQNVLITVETWLKGASYGKDILNEVINGQFDDNIRQLADIAAKSEYDVYFRWAPDMEVPASVYPWQFKSATSYITAFNYFAGKIKQYAPRAKIVWGPSGYPGDTEYWPGNKAVDFVSLTLGSPSEYSLNVYPKDKTVSEMLKHKLHRLRFINKPILIISSVNAPKVELKDDELAAQKAYINKYGGTVYSVHNYTDTAKIKPKRKSLKIGVFDPNKKLVNQKQVDVEHLFTDWGEVQRGEFEVKFKEVLGRRHEPIVTMEPWRDTLGVAEVNTLSKILTGKYDTEIKRLFKIISATDRTVYLRWMHEMEIPIHRYAWQSQDPVTYINAFRYFMRFHGGPGKNVKKVWGPAGDRGSIDYWPGDDVVDYISIAIYGLPDKNITDPEKQEAFGVIFNRKFHRMRFLEKPLFITEFGVKGPEKYQDFWLAGAAKTINNNPNVFGICYFNLYDNPKAWGDIKAPDWSISSRSMDKFIKQLKVQ